MISVVIPTKDRAACVIRLLQSLNHQHLSDYEVIVVDQSNPVDSSVRSLLESSPRGTYIWTPPRGVAEAMNVGLARAKGDVVVFLDDDAFPDSRDLLAAYRAAFMRGYQVVQGRIVEPDDSSAEPRRVGQLALPLFRTIRNFHATAGREIEIIGAANFAVSRAAVEAVGEFDATLGHPGIHFETDFAIRARRQGLRIWFEPTASVTHLRAESGGERVVGADAARVLRTAAYRHKVYVTRKHFSPPVIVATVVTQIAMALSLAATGRIGGAKAALRGVYEGLTKPIPRPRPRLQHRSVR